MKIKKLFNILQKGNAQKEKKENEQKEDPFAKLLGDFGRWQFLILSTVSVVKLSTGWVQMAILFLTPNLNFRCTNLHNTTDDIINNTCYKDCVEYEYDTSPFDNTIVSEWNLICERRWLASFTQMMLQLGITIGSLIFGYLSDRYGRKNTFLWSVSGVIVTSFAVPFSPNYAVFTALRTLLGVATAGTMIVSFVIVMESVGPKYREMAGCLFHIPFMIGHMTLPLFAYYFRSWDKYTLALAVPQLIYLGYFFTITESPRWLISRGRLEEATNIIKKAVTMNNLPTTNVEVTLKQLIQDSSKSDKLNVNYTMLFKKSLLLRTICCCVMWFIFGILFFGLNQYISQTSPNPFVSVAIAGAIQIPSNLLTIWLIKRFGRRVIISTCFILSGTFVIILYYAPNIFSLTLTFGSLGVSCGSIVGTSIYVYTLELFPTVVRNMGIGISSLCMRIGSMIAPFIANIAFTLPWLPSLILGGAALVAGLVCLLLSETKGVALSDNIEDITCK